MAQDKDQLVDERAMEKMSVAPPDPKTGASQDGLSDDQSGVADQDPLSAHPS